MIIIHHISPFQPIASCQRLKISLTPTWIYSFPSMHLTGCHISRTVPLPPSVANVPSLQPRFRPHKGSPGTDNRSIRRSLAPQGLRKRQTTAAGCLALAHPYSKGSEGRIEGSRSLVAPDRSECFSEREGLENQNRWPRDLCCWSPREAGSDAL